METQVLSTYGTDWNKKFRSPLTAESTYGGVDAALTESPIGHLKVETGYGQFYTTSTLNSAEKDI